ncbi:hypothetical protein [Emticicia sp.]|uniref:hypothetical protein n=1 Tax=Emticicia sp. TaxID=1930953 RepID=UPI0037509F8E
MSLIAQIDVDMESRQLGVILPKPMKVYWLINRSILGFTSANSKFPTKNLNIIKTNYLTFIKY